MPDEDDKKRIAEMVERTNAKLEAADPLFTVSLSLPLKIWAQIGGGLTIDSPCLALAGFDRAAVVRLQIPPEVAESLWQALEQIRKNPDMQPPEGGAPVAH